MLTQSNNLFTLGKLYRVEKDANIFIAHTLEKPWQGNEPWVSCIPDGNYLIKPTTSPKFGQTYYFESVLGGIVDLTNAVRTHCLFHKANHASELHGCVTLGSSVGVIYNKHNKPEFAVLNSRKTINPFLKELNGFDYRFKIIRR